MSKVNEWIRNGAMSSSKTVDRGLRTVLAVAVEGDEEDGQGHEDRHQLACAYLGDRCIRRYA